LLRNGANILKIIIYEWFVLNFSILGLIFHNRSKKCLNQFTDEGTIFADFSMPTQVVSLVHVVPSATSPTGVAVCSAWTTAGFFLFVYKFLVHD
jgi:hypothetical protein